MNGQQTEEITALYCRFSQDDGKKESDSNSIQRVQILPLRRLQAQQPDEGLQHPLYP